MVQQTHAGHAWTERELKILNAVFERRCGSLLQHVTGAAALWVWTGCQVHTQMRGEHWTLRPSPSGAHGTIPACHFSGREDSRAGHLMVAVEGCEFSQQA